MQVTHLKNVHQGTIISTIRYSTEIAVHLFYAGYKWIITPALNMMFFLCVRVLKYVSVLAHIKKFLN